MQRRNLDCDVCNPPVSDLLVASVHVQYRDYNGSITYGHACTRTSFWQPFSWWTWICQWSPW